MALVSNKIDALKPASKDFRKADGGGLYLLVRTTGSKLWRYDYRLGAVRRTLAIGEFSKDGDGRTSFTLGQARDVHDKARQAVARGQHPVSPAKAAADATAAAVAAREAQKTFGTLADLWLTTRKANRAPKSYARDMRSVKYLKDGYKNGKGFGSLLVDQVGSAHLSDLIGEFNKPTRIWVISAAKKIMAIAKRDELIQHSPFSDVNFNEGFAKHKVKKRPAITDEEKFGELMRSIDGYQGRASDFTKSALQLLALTFVRPDLVAKAEWKHFDLDNALWVIPFEMLKMEWLRSETGEPEEDFYIPLSRQAVALLRELSETTGKDRYLFPGTGDAEAMSESTINFALHSLGFKGTHCAHGFRSSASTVLNRQRVDGRRKYERALIELQLDHQDASVRAIYDRDDCLPERIELMQFWADKIDGLRGGGEKKKAELKIVAG